MIAAIFAPFGGATVRAILISTFWIKGFVMAGTISHSDTVHSHRWRPWLSPLVLALAVFAAVGAHWLAFPENVAPTAGQSGAVAVVAGLLAAALLRLWDAWDRLRSQRLATDASLERLNSALARADAADEDPNQEQDTARNPSVPTDGPQTEQGSALDARFERLRADLQRDRQQLRQLRATEGFEAAWRARFGPAAPDPDQLAGQLEALLGREDEAEQH